MSSIFSNISIFYNEPDPHIRWPRYWSFSFSNSPYKEYSRLNSFRTNWFDLLTIQGTLKRLLQQYNLKASFLWHSALFMIQLLHRYMPTEKTIDLTVQTFVNKVMSLLSNMLSWFVIAFLTRNKCLLISWVQPPSTVILEAPPNKCCLCFHFSPYICHEVMRPVAIILVF